MPKVIRRAAPLSSPTRFEKSLDFFFARLVLGVLAGSAALLVLTKVVPGSANAGGVPLRSIAKILFVPSAAGLVVYLIARRLGGPGAGGEWLARLSLVLLSVTVGVIAGEGMARWFLRDVTTVFDTRYFPSVRWYGAGPIAYNSWGFRERELSGAPRGEAYRIAAIGDGFLHSQGIADEDLLTRALERELNKRSSGRRFEVLNFSHAGAQTEDETGYLVDRALEVEPDYVLLQWFINDSETDRRWRTPTLDLPWVDLIEGSLGVSFRRELRGRSALFYSVAHWIGAIGTRRGWLETYEQHMTARLSDDDGEDARAARAALSRFVSTARSHGLPVGVVAFPILTEVHGSPENYPLGFLIDRVIGFCAEEGLRCLDVRQVLAGHAPARSLWINRLDGHPGPLANRLVAEALTDVFGSDWGLTAAR
jgi:hypothetical protein